MYETPYLGVRQDSQNKPVSEAIWRGSVSEAMQSTRLQAQGLPNTFSLYENAFIDLRQTVSALILGTYI